MRKRRNLTKLLVIIIILLLMTISGFLVLVFNNEKEEIIMTRSYTSETLMPTNIDGIIVHTKFISKDSKRRQNEKREIKYITIHETDNRNRSANALKHASFLLTNNDAVNGWHYSVDETYIVHHLPDNEVAYHAGDKRSPDGGNMNGIGIEMCVNVDGNYDTTLENTVKLVAFLMDEYDLSIEDVKLHRDFSGKICPHRMISEGRVEEFYDKVKDYYSHLRASRISFKS